MSNIAGDTVWCIRPAPSRAAPSTISTQALAEVGIDIAGQTPKLIDRQLVRDVHVVVTLGREAHVGAPTDQSGGQRQRPETLAPHQNSGPPAASTFSNARRIRSMSAGVQPSGGATATTPPPGLRPAAVALRATQNSGLALAPTAEPPDPSRQSTDGCALWSRLETRYLRLPSPLRHNIFRQTRAPFGPHSDEDLRWRPGARQACHFASVIANNLSIWNPQAASRR